MLSFAICVEFGLKRGIYPIGRQYNSLIAFVEGVYRESGLSSSLPTDLAADKNAKGISTGLIEPLLQGQKTFLIGKVICTCIQLFHHRSEQRLIVMSYRFFCFFTVSSRKIQDLQ